MAAYIIGMQEIETLALKENELPDNG